MLRDAVAKLGTQRTVARLVGVNQGTISRTLEPGSRATYTTLTKFQRAIPELPSPIVSIRDAAHERWCRMGAALQAEKPLMFDMLLKAAGEALGKHPDDGKSDGKSKLRVSPPDTDRLLATAKDPRVRKRSKRGQ